MNETQEKPVDCRPVEVEQIYRCNPEAEGFKLDGVNIARVSRGRLLRFAIDKNIEHSGDSKIDIYNAIGYHLKQIGWPVERDIGKLKKGKAV